MHHRRNRKPRQEIKRQGHHKARRATQRALEGSQAAVVRGEHYSASMPQPPLNDRSSMGKKRKKTKVMYCPGREGNKRHEYLTDTEVVKVSAWMSWTGRGYTYERTFKLCVHCGIMRHVRGNRYW